MNSNWDGNYTQSAGTFTAANNATISGTATFSGDVALDENLNVGSLVFADATVAYDVNNDLFTVTTGGITFSGSNTLNATFASGVQLGTYDIAVVTGGGTVADPSTWTYTLGSTHLDGYNLDARAVTLGTGASITTIDILDFRPGEYTILTASGFGTSIDNDTFATKVGGGNLAARQSVDYTNSTGTSVVMTLATLGNVALTGRRRSGSR